MTSTSSVGQARITLQFGLDRDINGAARDVQAAINAARADLPTSLRSNPTYRKVNPADAPILILALTSKTLTRGQIYDAATNVLSQTLSQIDGIGQVIIGGAALPAVRVELNPTALFKYGIGLEDVRAALASANANSPKGAIEDGGQHYQIYTNDQAIARGGLPAADRRLPQRRRGAAVRCGATCRIRSRTCATPALANGKPAVLVILFRQPGANIIDTVDGVKAALPQLKAAMPRDIDLTIANDRTTTIRASLHDTETTLLIAVVPGDPGGVPVPAQRARDADPGGRRAGVAHRHVRRDVSAGLQPRQPVADGADGRHRLRGRRRDRGAGEHLAPPRGGHAAHAGGAAGAREVGFTVLSMSLSLIAVFMPILLMGGIVGRLFREFAMTLSLAILVSLVISLTTTPMMCALFLKPAGRSARARSGARCSTARWRCTSARLAWSLRHGALVMLVLLVTIGLNVALLRDRAEGLLPAAGHRPDDRRDPGRPEHLVPGDGAEAGAVDRHRAARSGGAERGRLHRRAAAAPAADQYRLGLRRAEAAVAARRASTQVMAGCAASWRWCRARGCS